MFSMFTVCLAGSHVVSNTPLTFEFAHENIPIPFYHYQNQTRPHATKTITEQKRRDFYEELSKFGRLEALHICDNLGDHMIGHVYAKFSEEEEAADALNVMNGRHYAGRRMEVEFSPVTDFREARCRDFDEDTCRRGGFCNFMHIKPVPMCLIRDMEEDAEEERRREEMERMERRRKDERRSRRGDRKDRDRHRSGGGSGRREGSGGGGSRGKDRRSRSRSRSESRSGSRERGSGGDEK